MEKETIRGPVTEPKKDLLDELAQNLMLAMIVAASVFTLLSVIFQFISADIKTLFSQLAYYSYGWMVFLALGPSVKRAAFMRIDLLAGRYPSALQDVLKTVCNLLLFVMMVLLCWFSIQNLRDAVASGAVNANAPLLPLALAYTAPVIGYALGVIAYIVKFMESRKGAGGGTGSPAGNETIPQKKGGACS